MRVRIGTSGWYLCDGADPSESGTREWRGDEGAAFQWLNQFREDVIVMGALRRLLASTRGPLDDDEVVRQAARRLGCGVWIARRPIEERAAGGGGSSAPAEMVAFPKEERQSTLSAARTSTSQPEPPTFPPHADLAAIAEAQKKASALGIPFCEECAKAALAGAQA